MGEGTAEMLTIGTIRWFGPTWGQDPRTEIPVPAGEECLVCTAVIEEHDQGVRLPRLSKEGNDCAYYHLRCFLLTVLDAQMAAEVIARNPGIK